MIITISTPDEYYYNQLISFLMSMKINSPEHIKMVRVFLANYPNELYEKLKVAFPEVVFKVYELKMMDERGFSTIIDRALKIKTCFKKFKENIIWMDTDLLIRGNISNFVEIKKKELKILYRPEAPERAKINAGVFNIGFSEATYNFICDWYDSIKENKRWGQGQSEFWKLYKRKYNDKIRLTDITRIYNSAGHFKHKYIIWHCKMGHFDNSKYQNEYQEYLRKAKEFIEEKNG